MNHWNITGEYIDLTAEEKTWLSQAISMARHIVGIDAAVQVLRNDMCKEDETRSQMDGFAAFGKEWVECLVSITNTILAEYCRQLDMFILQNEDNPDRKNKAEAIRKFLKEWDQLDYGPRLEKIVLTFMENPDEVAQTVFEMHQAYETTYVPHWKDFVCELEDEYNAVEDQVDTAIEKAMQEIPLEKFFDL